MQTQYGAAPLPRRSRRGTRVAESGDWRHYLPAAWKELVVTPVAFDVFREYEIAAHRTVGRDEDGQPCYCASRCVLTQLRSDDDDVFYETVAYAEDLTAWRLRDERWLIWREVAGPCHGAGQRFFTLGDAMPR